MVRALCAGYNNVRVYSLDYCLIFVNCDVSGQVPCLARDSHFKLGRDSPLVRIRTGNCCFILALFQALHFIQEPNERFLYIDPYL